MAAKFVDHFASIRELRHAYFALRHGKSLANELGVISSDPAFACSNHGLAKEGVEQVKRASASFAADLAADSRVAVFSSDFKRARETAEILAEQLVKDSVLLHGDGVQLETRLRERWFGELESKGDDSYDLVWQHDAQSAEHQEFGCESLHSVLARTTEFVLSLEAQSFADPSDQAEEGLPWQVFLVAHGDVLQIVQTAFARVDVCTHRSLPHLETATIRKLDLHQAAVSEELQEVYGEYLDYYNNQKDRGWKS